MCNKSRTFSKFSPYSMVGTPLLLKVGGDGGVGPSKNWVTWGGGDTKNFARKGGGVDAEMGGYHFLLLYSSIAFTECVSVSVCVCGGGEYSVFYYILVLQSFELTMQDLHPSLYGIKTLYVYFWPILIVYWECRLLYLN